MGIDDPLGDICYGTWMNGIAFDVIDTATAKRLLSDKYIYNLDGEPHLFWGWLIPVLWLCVAMCVLYLLALLKPSLWFLLVCFSCESLFVTIRVPILCSDRCGYIRME